MTQRTFDRIPSRFHPRMLLFAATPLVADRKPRSYTWACTAYLDQGSEGACVGFGWTHEAAAKPKVWKGLTAQVAYDVYHWAQENDPWPGVDYEGTSVDAGAKAARERGWISAWYWAGGAREVVLVLGHQGPVVIGIDWLEGMDDPDGEGWLHVTGPVRGGHCTLLRGVRLVWRHDAGYHPWEQTDWWDRLDLDASYVLLHNSWGPVWANHGTAKVSLRDLHVLLDERGGEACVPTRLPVRTH